MFKALLVVVTMAWMGHANATLPSCTQTVYTWTMSGLRTVNTSASSYAVNEKIVEGMPTQASCKAVGDAEKLLSLQAKNGSSMYSDFDYQCTRVESFAFAKIKFDCVFP